MTFIRKTRRKKRFKPLKFIIIATIAFGLLHFHVIDFFQYLLLDNQAYTLAQSSSYVDPYENVPLHHYNWDNLIVTDKQIDYIDEEGNKAMQGIDLSRYQGDVDWSQINSSNVSFAMLRVGYRGYKSGIIKLDDKFTQNIQQAENKNIQVGVYFFSQAITEAEAIEEANFVLQYVEDYPITLPIVFDLEEISASDHRTYNLTQEQRTNIAISFCERIKEAGYTPMIYGNASWLTDCYDLTQISQYDIWLAQYADCPSFPYAFKMWQYTNSGTLDGINHSVDKNIYFISES